VEDPDFLWSADYCREPVHALELDGRTGSKEWKYTTLDDQQAAGKSL